MTTQINGGYQDGPYEDSVSYLGSILGSTPTTSLLGTSIFPGFTQNYMTGDKTWITEILGRFYQKMYNDHQGGSGTLGNVGIQIIMNAYLQSLASGDRPTPKDLDEFAADFVDWALTNIGFTSPARETERALMLDGGNTTDIRKALFQVISANLGVATGSFVSDLQVSMAGLLASDVSEFTVAPVPSQLNYDHPSIGATGMGLVSLPNHLAIIDAMVNQSIGDAAKSLVTLANSSSSLTALDGLNQYYTRFAAVANYLQVYQAFYLNDIGGPGSGAQTALYNFIVTLTNDPNGDGLNYSQDFGAWFTAVKENYIAAINGNGSLALSAMGPSSAKVAIINRIYALIAEMIEVIQKTTAAQADQLKVLSVLQGEMTNMISKAPILTSSSDGELGDSDTDDNQSTLRDELNSVITAWTDTIRAQRDFIKSQAQTQQTNVNNSNDAVNQQASMATALIQQQSTLLSAIYR